MIWKKSSPFTCFITLLVALFSLGIFGTLFTVQNVSAISYSSTGRLNLTSGLISYSGISTTVQASTISGGLHFSFNQPGYNVNSVQLCYSGTIPANSIVTISVSTDNPYRPFQPTRNAGSYSVLSVQYGEYGRTSISLYFSASVDSCFYINPLDFPSGYNASSAMNFNISRLNYITLNSEPTASQLEDIKTKLDDFNSTIANIEDYILDISTDTSHISSIIDSLYSRIGNILNTNTTISNNVLLILRELQSKDNQEQQDRDNVENQQSSTDSSADSAQSSVESSSASIISNITSIVGALNTSATNCNINLDTGNLQLTNVNLCSVPNEIRSLINNIMVLIVTVSVLLCSYSLIRQFLSLYESFLAGGKS